MDITRRRFVFKSVGMAVCGGLSAFGSEQEKPDSMKTDAKTFFRLYPVGRVEKKGNQAWLHIFEKYVDALTGLDGFSHVLVFYWFHKNDTPAKRSILQVHPRGNRQNPLTGVFACRAPVRPNLIALSLCRILSVKGPLVHIDRIDAFDHSPVLDLKPYIPAIDSQVKDLRLPDWLGR
jgi:tRNA-Thr(GGU) m(6)t(6)A37 methyltransferase TsaA